MKRSEISVLAILFVLVLCSISFVSYKIHRRQSPPPNLVTFTSTQIIGNSPDYKGKATAPYTLVEFGDMECPACQRADRDLVALLKKYPSLVKLAYRHFPLSIHPHAFCLAKILAGATLQHHFWSLHDRMMINSSSLDCTTALSLAQADGLEMKKLQSDLATKSEAIVHQEMRDGKLLALSGTPALFLICPDGKIYGLPRVISATSLLPNQ